MSPQKGFRVLLGKLFSSPPQGSCCYQQLETLPSSSLTKEARPEIFVSFLMSGRVFLQQMSKSAEEIKNNSENMEINLIPVALDTQKMYYRNIPHTVLYPLDTISS